MAEHYTFKLPENINRSKVHFKNHFGIELLADLYSPKNLKESGNAAIAVCGPFGAVKEQASGLYACKMAEMGFITLAFDP
ncbi:MAG: alpha/beta hydrolase, partial [Treponema sp.]|nr:alpha/beta hydrolase [Treponema sp.]